MVQIMTIECGVEFRKAAEALVDAATVGLCVDGNVVLHPSLRDFLVDEVVENPSLTPHLFKDNFIEEFLREVALNSGKVSC
jgi:hypothetical protein